MSQGTFLGGELLVPGQGPLSLKQQAAYDMATSMGNKIELPPGVTPNARIIGDAGSGEQGSSNIVTDASQFDGSQTIVNHNSSVSNGTVSPRKGQILGGNNGMYGNSSIPRD